MKLRLFAMVVAALPISIHAGEFGPLLTAENGTFPENACAIHLIHVVGGDFLFFGRAPISNLKSWTFNAFNGKFSEPIDLGPNVFCCGVSQLPDGRPIIVGGDMNGTGSGVTSTFIFDLVDEELDQVGNLSQTRWYPTPALLADGTLAAISGWGDVPEVDWRDRIDVFNASNGTWADFMPTFHSSVPQSVMQPHFYPFMFAYYDALAPTARKLFFAGRATVDDIGEGYTYKTYSLNFTSNGAAEWSLFGGDSVIPGSGAVMMINGTHPIDAGTIYKFGGQQGSSVLGLGRKIDLNDGDLEWVPTASMPELEERTECNVVAMPDGRIALVGGTTSTSHLSLPSTGVNNIIIYNPATNSYDEISDDFAGTRMYHSTATPSPTGTIFLAGGDYHVPDPLNPGQFIAHSNYTAQEYYPTYFTIDAMPATITAAPTRANWNTTIQVTATGPVDHFALLKLTSTTHAFDTTQRYIKMTAAATPSGNNYQLYTPKNGGIAPPGYYMLFAISTYGVPSVAKYIKIGPS